jgi:mevalonate kinase
MNRVKISSPGKLMLFGDHAVVHGRQCLVTAVNQRLMVTVESVGEIGQITLNAPEVDLLNFEIKLKEFKLDELPKSARFVAQAVKNFAEKHQLKSGLQIKTASEFSATFGFGSSSAVTAATIKALSELHSLSLSNQEIFELAYKTVLDIQGVGSGFDLAAAIWGGTLLFAKGGQEIKPLDVTSLPLIVGYTGVKADTTTLVKAVGAKHSQYPEQINAIFDLMQSVVELSEPAIVAQDWSKLGELMNINQGLLNAIDVSSPELESQIFAARQAGAYGAKLSGAGGGDCFICFAPSTKTNKVKSAIKQAGGQVLEVQLSAKGIKVENAEK